MGGYFAASRNFARLAGWLSNLCLEQSPARSGACRKANWPTTGSDL